MPGAWDDAVLTFQISTDNKMFNDLFTHEGNELELIVVAGVGVLVPPDWLRSANYLKFRSGTRDAPVLQSELREFAIAVEVP